MRIGAKRIAESCQRLDLSRLLKEYGLSAGGTVSMSWQNTHGGATKVRVKMSHESDWIEIQPWDYHTPSPIQEYSQVIRLTHQRQHFGGTRPYFLCPTCRTKRRVLYARRVFACWECHDLTYYTRVRDEMDVANHLLDKLQRKYGLADGTSTSEWQRPKYMRLEKYWQICWKVMELQRRNLRGLDAQIAIEWPGMYERIKADLKDI